MNQNQKSFVQHLDELESLCERDEFDWKTFDLEGIDWKVLNLQERNWLRLDAEELNWENVLPKNPDLYGAIGTFLYMYYHNALYELWIIELEEVILNRALSLSELELMDDRIKQFLSIPPQRIFLASQQQKTWKHVSALKELEDQLGMEVLD
jgi:hypothetical protein